MTGRGLIKRLVLLGGFQRLAIAGLIVALIWAGFLATSKLGSS